MRRLQVYYPPNHWAPDQDWPHVHRHGRYCSHTSLPCASQGVRTSPTWWDIRPWAVKPWLHGPLNRRHHLWRWKKLVRSLFLYYYEVVEKFVNSISWVFKSRALITSWRFQAHSIRSWHNSSQFMKFQSVTRSFMASPLCLGNCQFSAATPPCVREWSKHLGSESAKSYKKLSTLMSCDVTWCRRHNPKPKLALCETWNICRSKRWHSRLLEITRYLLRPCQTVKSFSLGFRRRIRAASAAVSRTAPSVESDGGRCRIQRRPASLQTSARTGRTAAWRVWGVKELLNTLEGEVSEVRSESRNWAVRVGRGGAVPDGGVTCECQTASFISIPYFFNTSNSRFPFPPHPSNQ